MEPEELDIALEELEIRLERLRALYEQYFLGIEKLEPQIPRKDVDRRLYVLRREKIRNTGKRFKLQTLIQRYNTFAQYWQRICREIENGTYKRHVLRAEKNIGPTELLTIAARRRFGKDRTRFESARPSPPVSPLSPETVEQPQLVAAPALDEPGTAAERVIQARASSSIPPARSRTPTWPGLPSPPPAALETPTAPRINVTIQRIPPIRVPSGLQPPDAGDAAAYPVASFSAPLRDERSSTPRPAAPSAPSAIARPAVAGPWSPIPRPATPVTTAKSSVPRPGAPAATKSPIPKPAAPFESLELDMDFMADWDPRTNTKGPSAVGVSKVYGAPTAPSAPDRSPPGAGRLAPEGRRPAPERPAPERPALERPAPKPLVEPRLPTPAAANQPRSREQPGPAGGAKVPRVGESISEARLRDVHERLLEASKTSGQQAVSFEGLSRSLRATEAKLRAQHGDRKIDFQVVMKDGKAVVKPVVR